MDSERKPIYDLHAENMDNHHKAIDGLIETMRERGMLSGVYVVDVYNPDSTTFAPMNTRETVESLASEYRERGFDVEVKYGGEQSLGLYGIGPKVSIARMTFTETF